MNDLKDLYQEVIMDHKRHPRNFHAMDDADRAIDGRNPLCGDELRLYLKLDGDTVSDVSFEGSGCAISVASASMLTERIKGMQVTDAEALFEQMHRLLTEDLPDADTESLGKLRILAGVRNFPNRVKCASLCWHTLKAALDEQPPSSVTTE